MSIQKKFIQYSSAAALLCLPAVAGITTNHTGPLMTTIIDFSTTTTHQNWSTWTPPSGGNAGTKQYRMNLNGGSNGKCFLVSFEARTAGDAGTDIRLWTPPIGGTAQSLDNDGPGTKLPKAKVWALSVPTYLTVSALNSSYNSVDFLASTFVIESATSSGQCQTAVDSNLPFYNGYSGERLHADNPNN